MISSVLAVLALNRLGLKPRRTVKLYFAADEEMGSAYGIGWLIENHGDLFTNTDIALIPDSGDPSGASVEIAEKNLVWARFVTKGTQTHGSRPDLGANAHLAGADLALRLHYVLSEQFNERDSLFDPDYSTFQPTKKEANVPNINTIPGKDIFCMDMRILPEYSVDSVLEQVDKIVKAVETDYRVTINYNIVQKQESKATAQDAPIVKKLSDAITKVYDVEPRPIGIGGGTMAAFLRNIGIDCAVWTKTQGTLHMPNEYALLDNILGDAKVMAVLASGRE
jgi:succinyl-diaminopimelate desuccinylase